MDLNINNHLFLVCGASSGFGKAIATQLLDEGARVIAIARRKEKLQALADAYPRQVQTICQDITQPSAIQNILASIGSQQLHGVLINAGGPPALSALETTMKQWDEAYQLVLRWKVELTKKLIPVFHEYDYGRILFIESQSVKQPIPNLVLSNAFRAGVVGFAKTLSQEIAARGITVNVLAPGSHATPAIERVINKKSETSAQNYEEVKKQMERNIPVGRMGTGEEIASLATWILSPQAAFVTGQTISHDGGNIRGLFG
ncbi:MAG: SDR family oxidoreductase [Balneolaceae bacterium]|nr:SDR family oxidoreductase [Balneolaceae bacterium]